MKTIYKVAKVSTPVVLVKSSQNQIGEGNTVFCFQVLVQHHGKRTQGLKWVTE